jgi:hypothetical protein
MQLWRVMLAIWLSVIGVIWMVGPTFPEAFAIEGLLGALAAVFLILNTERRL